MFGDAVMGVRQPEIQLAWQYGQDSIAISEAVAGTGEIAYADQMIEVSTGDGVGSATAMSKRRLRYEASFDGYASFTARFSEPQPNTAQRIGLYDADNGFFIEYSMLGKFLVVRRDGVDQKTPMNSEFWASTDMTKLNIWRITYAYLGAGPVVLEQYISTDAGWLVVAKFDQVGDLEVPHVAQPSLPFRMGVVRSEGEGDPIVLRSAAVGCGRVGACGDIPSTERKFAASSEKSIVADTLTNVITIKASETFNGSANGVEALIAYFSAAADGAKSVRLSLVKGATLGGTPSFTPLETGSSVTSYDTSGTTVTGGTTLLVAAISKTGQASQILTPLDFRIVPGEQITLAALSAQSSTVTASLTVKELF